MNLLRLLSKAIGKLIDVNIGWFLVPREPRWELHREVSRLGLLARKLCRAVAREEEGVGKYGQVSKPYTSWQSPAFTVPRFLLFQDAPYRPNQRNLFCPASFRCFRPRSDHKGRLALFGQLL